MLTKMVLPISLIVVALFLGILASCHGPNDNTSSDASTDAGTDADADADAETALPECVRYVNLASTAANQDGMSWETAFNKVQNGIESAYTAADGDLAMCEVWVAKGTYYVHGSVGNVDPKTDTVQLRSNVDVYGGFSGSEAFRGDRDWVTHETVLNGHADLGETPQVFHVVTGNDNAVLDGFIITGGKANRGHMYPADNHGGGMFNDGSSPMVANCIFIDNSAASSGGGIYNHDSSTTITSCTFTGNSADRGGGISNHECSPMVTGCIFTDNEAYVGGGIENYESSATVTRSTFTGNSADYGGAMNNYLSHPTVTSCTFTGNSADSGGGMRNYGSAPTVTSCTFTSNSAQDGGGMYNYTSHTSVTSCIFTSNSANYGVGSAGYGGGMYNDFSNPSVTSCVLSGNSADYGGGISNGGASWTNGTGSRVKNCTFIDNLAQDGGGMYGHTDSYSTVTNSIMWGDSPQEISISSSTTIVTFSDVEGGYAGEGNINESPKFVNAPSNLDIEADSPCIDAADGGSAPELDLNGNPRIDANDEPPVNSGIGPPWADMGAYEYQP